MRINTNSQHLLLVSILLCIFVLAGMVEFFRYWDHASKLSHPKSVSSSNALKGE